MKPIIEVKNIGKKYTINHNKGGYVALRDVLTEMLRAPLAFFKKKVLTTKEPFWALKDVNFTVEKGEVIGVIGKNGAGKSTLLKILSRITPPTTGEIKIHGTVGSLLEVGTGFHPELTGRENIFLNGAILGMKKAEIVQKFDEIVAFAGIEQFLDTPVKYYSSGMYVRLAFSVAAHMEPDILIIDEVLAVGDAEFQKKCLGKMEELTTKDARTILFVSHNIDAIRRLCKKVVWINKGEIVMQGKTEDVIRAYTEQGTHTGKSRWENTNEFNNKHFTPHILEAIKHKEGITLHIEAEVEEPAERLTIGYALYNDEYQLLYYSYPTDTNESFAFKKGRNILTTEIPTDILNAGIYTLELIGGIHGKGWIFEPKKNVPTIIINVEKDFGDHYYWNEKRFGILAPRLLWKN